MGRPIRPAERRGWDVVLLRADRERISTWGCLRGEEARRAMAGAAQVGCGRISVRSGITPMTGAASSPDRRSPPTGIPRHAGDGGKGQYDSQEQAAEQPQPHVERRWSPRRDGRGRRRWHCRCGWFFGRRGQRGNDRLRRRDSRPGRRDSCPGRRKDRPRWPNDRLRDAHRLDRRAGDARSRVGGRRRHEHRRHHPEEDQQRRRRYPCVAQGPMKPLIGSARDSCMFTRGVHDQFLQTGTMVPQWNRESAAAAAIRVITTSRRK